MKPGGITQTNQHSFRTDNLATVCPQPRVQSATDGAGPYLHSYDLTRQQRVA